MDEHNIKGPGAGHAGPPPIDVASLLARCMDSAAVAAMCLTKFEAQLRDDLAALERGLSARDAAAIVRVAHGLKGAAGMVGAGAVAEAAAAMEVRARAGDIGTLAACLGELVREADRCVGALPASRAQLGRAAA